MPVRRIPHRRGSATGKFPSLKMQRMIAFESLLERDFIYLLDYEPSVKWFEEQPLRIEYGQEDKHLHYTPDFHLIEAEGVHPDGQHVLVECKPTRWVDSEDNRRKFAVAQDWCQERGWQFCPVTEQRIRSGYRLPNIQQLTRYARYNIDCVLRGQILAFLAPPGKMISIQQLAETLCPCHPQLVIASLLHLAYHHHLTLEIDGAPISRETTVSLRSHDRGEVGR